MFIEAIPSQKEDGKSNLMDIFGSNELRNHNNEDILSVSYIIFHTGQ